MKFVRDYSFLQHNEFLCIPIMENVDIHPNIDNPCFYYFSDLTTQEEFILNFTHNDCDCAVPTDTCLPNRIFVWNKKGIKNYKEVFEAKILPWLRFGKIDEPQNLKIKFYTDRYHGVSRLNRCIPLMVWLEYCRDIRSAFNLSAKSQELNNTFLEYDLLLTDLIHIEKNGLWNGMELEYSNYNLFTLTGRPSNSYNKINYAALDKSNGDRRRFHSRFNDGILVEIDIQSYHPILISKILGLNEYNAGGNIYEILQAKYFNDMNIKQIKEIVFQNIYGSVDAKYQHVDFFAKIQQLSLNLFEQYRNNTLTSILFRRPIVLPGLRPNQVFNYLIQNLETEMNSVVLNRLNSILKNFSSKLILYTYDSFLFDLNVNREFHVLEKIVAVFNEMNLPFKIKYGKNYHDMKIYEKKIVKNLSM